MAGQVLQVPYPIVGGSRFLLGPDLQAATFLIIPQSTDTYPAGGYVITAIEAGFKMIQQAIVTGANTTVLPSSPTVAWYAFPVFPETQLGPTASPGAGFSGYSQFLLKVYVGSSGVENSASLVGCIWQVMIIGY